MRRGEALQTIRDWLASYPGYDILANFQVDYTDCIPAGGGIFPAGLVEVRRTRDVLGGVAAVNQLNFGLYYVFEKSPGDDLAAQQNQDWLLDFQDWVQEQSLLRLAPTFGDEPLEETIKAQNGTLYEADPEGLATYLVTLSVQYIKNYDIERSNCNA